MSEGHQGERGELVPLSKVPAGTTVRVARLTGGRGMVARLTNMGLNAGSEITVMRNDPAGPLIVRCKGSRLALGRGVLDRIFTEALR